MSHVTQFLTLPNNQIVTHATSKKDLIIYWWCSVKHLLDVYFNNKWNISFAPYPCKTLHDFQSILMCYLGDDISKTLVQKSNHRVKKTNRSCYEPKMLTTLSWNKLSLFVWCCETVLGVVNPKLSFQRNIKIEVRVCAWRNIN